MSHARTSITQASTATREQSCTEVLLSGLMKDYFGYRQHIHEQRKDGCQSHDRAERCIEKETELDPYDSQQKTNRVNWTQKTELIITSILTHHSE